MYIHIMMMMTTRPGSIACFTLLCVCVQMHNVEKDDQETIVVVVSNLCYYDVCSIILIMTTMMMRW